MHGASPPSSTLLRVSPPRRRGRCCTVQHPVWSPPPAATVRPRRGRWCTVHHPSERLPPAAAASPGRQVIHSSSPPGSALLRLPPLARRGRCCTVHQPGVRPAVASQRFTGTTSELSTAAGGRRLRRTHVRPRWATRHPSAGPDLRCPRDHPLRVPSSGRLRRDCEAGGARCTTPVEPAGVPHHDTSSSPL